MRRVILPSHASCMVVCFYRLVEAGSDPHPKVKENARNAMVDISSVIRNPEIASLSPILLAAMVCMCVCVCRMCVGVCVDVWVYC